MSEWADAVPICGDIRARCMCHKTPGHTEDGDPVHECDQARCEGAWIAEPEFQVVRLPRAVGEPRAWPWAHL